MPDTTNSTGARCAPVAISEQEPTPDSVRAALELLQSYYAANGQTVTVRDTKPRKRKKRKEPVIVTPQEIDAILGAIDTRYPTQKRNHALVSLMAATGLRVGECLALREDAITLEGTVARVTVPDDEGAKVGHRVVYFAALDSNGNPTPVWASVSRWIEERYGWCDRLFDTVNGTPMHYLSIRRAIKGYAKRAGITKNVTPHAFRRAFATRLARAGVEPDAIRQAMGHTDIRTTAVYWQTDEKRLAEVAALDPWKGASS